MTVVVLLLAATGVAGAAEPSASQPAWPRSAADPAQGVVEVVRSIRSISAGPNAGLVVTTTGEVYGWGALRMPSRPGVSPPVPVPSLFDISAVSAGSEQFLALRGSGARGWTRGWGRNWFGSLAPADPVLGDQDPAPVVGFDDVVDVAATVDVSFAVTADGHVLAVGQDAFGGLGNGTPGVDSSVPVLVTDDEGTPLENIVEVAGYGQCNIARDTAGRVWEWGTNTWCSGSGGFSAALRPEFGPANRAVQVAVSWQVQYVLTDDGRVWTWGTNPLPGGISAPDPHPIDGLSDVKRIGGGVAVRANGTVWAWGFNDHGQVGFPADDSFNAPRQIAGLTDVVDVSSAGNWSMALKDDGTVWTWGDGTAGQLGDGGTADRPTPAQVMLPPVARPGDTLLAPEAGYWLVEQDGDLVAFGEAPELPSVKPDLAGAQAVAMAAHPDGGGVWVLGSNGDLVGRGSAADFGAVDLGLLTKPDEQMATLSATPDGDGLWVFTTAGRIIALGNATPANQMSGADAILALALDGPIIDSVATPSGRGAYLVASDGGVFTVGDAEFIESVRGELTALFGPPGLPDLPVIGIVPDPDGHGYWNVATDGGVFSFDAPFRGSLPAIVPFDQLSAPINGMVPYGNGYLLVAGDGGVFTFSDLPFEGSASGQTDTPIVDIASRT